MPVKRPTPLTESFATVPDPRVVRTREHELLDMIVIAVCAVICGADGWTDIETFGKAKRKWLKRILHLPNGIPSHDTFGRVFARLDPLAFQAGFARWMRIVEERTAGQVLALDGKVLRGSQDSAAGRSAIDMISAWATTNRMVLGQRKVSEKSNEITALPELLQLLEVSGCIVTIDAMGCQTEVATKIIERGGDYVLALKANQKGLAEDVTSLFEWAQSIEFEALRYDTATQVTKGHGRVDVRQCWTISDPTFLRDLRHADAWPQLRSVALIRATRQTSTTTTVETRYYISSLDQQARPILQATRAHWSIENQLHWVLDVTFNEDRCRVRKDHAPANLAVLRHIALNLLQNERTTKNSIKTKRLKAGWNDEYLLNVLLNPI